MVFNLSILTIIPHANIANRKKQGKNSIEFVLEGVLTNSNERKRTMLGTIPSIPQISSNWQPGRLSTKDEGILPKVQYVDESENLLENVKSPSNPNTGILELIRNRNQDMPSSKLAILPSLDPVNKIHLPKKLPARLENEIFTKSPPLRAVHINPGSDPFPPILQFQFQVAAAVASFSARGIQSWLATRGHIKPVVREVLSRHHQHVKVRIGISTLDRRVQRVLEPFSAPPHLRLSQLAALRRAGINVSVGLDPLVPGLTDNRANLTPLLEALADLGIRHITAGYLPVPIGAEENLKNALKPCGWDAMVLDAYAEGFVQREGRCTQTRYLPKAYRQRGYALIMSIAANYGITVSISAVDNPDFVRPPRQPTFRQAMPGFLFPIRQNLSN